MTPPAVSVNAAASSVLPALGVQYLATLLGAMCADLEPPERAAPVEAGAGSAVPSDAAVGATPPCVGAPLRHRSQHLRRGGTA